MNAFGTKHLRRACGTEHVYAGRLGLWVQRANSAGGVLPLHLLQLSLDVSPVAPEYLPATQLVHVGAVAAFAAVPNFPMAHAADLQDG